MPKEKKAVSEAEQDEISQEEEAEEPIEEQLEEPAEEQEELAAPVSEDGEPEESKPKKTSEPNVEELVNQRVASVEENLRNFYLEQIERSKQSGRDATEKRIENLRAEYDNRLAWMNQQIDDMQKTGLLDENTATVKKMANAQRMDSERRQSETKLRQQEPPPDPRRYFDDAFRNLMVKYDVEPTDAEYADYLKTNPRYGDDFGRALAVAERDMRKMSRDKEARLVKEAEKKNKPKPRGHLVDMGKGSVVKAGNPELVLEQHLKNMPSDPDRLEAWRSKLQKLEEAAEKGGR